MLFILICVFVQVIQISSSKILAIIPTASFSHHSAFRPLWKELVSRGHEVTVLTTNPQKSGSLPNFTEIDLSFTHEIYKKYDFPGLSTNYSEDYLRVSEKVMNLFMESQHAQFASPQVQELIQNKKIHFDLLLIEMLSSRGMLAFSWRFQCPFIVLAHLDCTMETHANLGNPIHPVLNPDYFVDVGDSEEMTFLSRLTSFIYQLCVSYLFYDSVLNKDYEIAKQYFGNDLPPLNDIFKNISMAFIGTHPIFHKLRPLYPNTIPISGGMHLEKLKPLPQDIQQFLDGAEDGAIFFSLGSSIVYNTMPEKLKISLVDAFAKIPYKVLLKIDGELRGISNNVMIKEWVPQTDILRHPNVKLFITHGGIMSLQEAVLCKIPLIAIPFTMEQTRNIDFMVRRGYGIKLDRREISDEILVSAIGEVMNNPKYLKKVEELNEILKDEEIPSLQRAVYWTEYVIRHKGARHLQNPAVRMPIWKYYMLDVIGFIVSIALLLTFSCYFLLKFMLQIILRLCRSRDIADQKKYK